MYRVNDAYFPQTRFHGQAATMSARYGFINTGASEIELIEPLSTPSPYTEFLEANGGDGVHHLAYIVDAIDPYIKHLSELGIDQTPLLDAAIGEDGRFVYVEHTAHGPRHRADRTVRADACPGTGRRPVLTAGVGRRLVVVGAAVRVRSMGGVVGIAGRAS